MNSNWLWLPSSATTPCIIRNSADVHIQSEIIVSFIINTINTIATIAIFYDGKTSSTPHFFFFFYGNMTPKSKMAVRKNQNQKDLTVICNFLLLLRIKLIFRATFFCLLFFFHTLFSIQTWGRWKLWGVSRFKFCDLVFIQCIIHQQLEKLPFPTPYTCSFSCFYKAHSSRTVTVLHDQTEMHDLVKLWNECI